jgi:hypothetical protein
MADRGPNVSTAIREPQMMSIQGMDWERVTVFMVSSSEDPGIYPETELEKRVFLMPEFSFFDDSVSGR